MKTKLLLITIALLFSMQLYAQEKTTTDIKSDSTTYQMYQQKKDEVVKTIVQIQSTIYESQEQLKDAYNKLSQLNIAIDLLEQKLKMYDETSNKKEEKEK
jgi:hypothetical protein